MNELLRRILFLPPQASTYAAEIDQLHYFVIIVTMAGAALVTLAGGYFLLRYRRSATVLHGRRYSPANITPLWIEAVVILSLFGLFLLWWVIGFVQFMHVRVPPEGALEIYVTGKQWMWKFAYPDGQHEISTLYVPTGRPVKLILTSRDAIHSFFVPEFRAKQDVIPGRFTTLWFEVKEPGRYPILCTEYCGVSHSTMRGEVIALAPEQYERWLRGGSLGRPVAGQEYEPPSVVGSYAPRELVSLAEQGIEAASRLGCLRCHTLDGTPHLGPTWLGLYGAQVPLAGGGEAVVDPAYITESMMDPMVKLHEGFQPIMPSYRGQIQPAESAAIVELIKSLRAAPPSPGLNEPWSTITNPGPAPLQGEGRPAEENQ